MNLKDRMNSGSQGLKPSGTEPQNGNGQTQSSGNTMQRSNPPSQEQSLLAKQSETLKLVTEQRDRLLSEGRPEDQKTISGLSSQISTLKSKISEMQSKHQSEIADLKEELSDTQKLNQSLTRNNRLLTQSNDDLRNRGGLMLRKEQQSLEERLSASLTSAAKAKADYDRQVKALREDCTQKIEEANARADEAETRCEKDNAAVAKTRSEGEAFRRKHQDLLKKEREKIDQLAEQKIYDTKAFLQEEKDQEILQMKDEYTQSVAKIRSRCEAGYAARETWHVLAFGFCILWLIIQAFTSNYFRGEIMKLFHTIGNYVVDMLGNIESWMESAAGIAHEIPNDIASVVIYWIILIIVGILLCLIFFGVPLLAVLDGSIIYLTSGKFDKLNRWIMIGSGILFVAMASELFYKPPVNLLLLWFLIQLAVPLLRYLIFPLIGLGIDKYQDMDDDERWHFNGSIIFIIAVIGIMGLLYRLGSWISSL